MLQIFLWIPASAAAAAVHPNGIKTFLANGLIIFFFNGNPIFSNGPRSLPRNPSDFTILDNWVFYSLILGNKLFAKDLQRFATCLLVSYKF